MPSKLDLLDWALLAVFIGLAAIVALAAVLS